MNSYYFAFLWRCHDPLLSALPPWGLKHATTLSPPNDQTAVFWASIPNVTVPSPSSLVKDTSLDADMKHATALSPPNNQTAVISASIPDVTDPSHSSLVKDTSLDTDIPSTATMNQVFELPPRSRLGFEKISVHVPKSSSVGTRATIPHAEPLRDSLHAPKFPNAPPIRAAELHWYRRFKEALLECGLDEVQASHPWANLVENIKGVIPRSAKLRHSLRLSAMGTFRELWVVSAMPLQHTLLAERCALQGERYYVLETIAGVIGVLFSAGVLSPHDTHMCLELLFRNPKEAGYLRAMHVLIARANNTMCQRTSALFMEKFLVTVNEYYTTELPHLDAVAQIILEVSKYLNIFKCFKLTTCHWSL